MDSIDSDCGSFAAQDDGSVTLRYERIYPRPIGTVWSAITQPERIADWLGAGELEPRVGGRFAVMVGPARNIQITGTVLTWEPPSVLACSWAWPQGGGTVIRYDLTAEGERATRLVFTHTGLPAGQQSSVLPGWHLYLERLGEAVEGAGPDADFRTRFAEIQAMYGRYLGTEAAACQPAANA